MFSRSNAPVWIGIVLVAGLFLMGQVWPTAVCDWIVDSSKVHTDCNVGIGTTAPKSTLDVAGEVGFQAGLVDSYSGCSEAEWGIIRRCLSGDILENKGLCTCKYKLGEWRWLALEW